MQIVSMLGRELEKECFLNNQVAALLEIKKVAPKAVFIVGLG
jgi:hypothetical protein